MPETRTQPSVDLWAQLYAVANGHVPTPEELAARLAALRTLAPVMTEHVEVRFLIEVLATIAQRGGTDAWLAQAALTVIGPTR